jgi:hypothetical protein
LTSLIQDTVIPAMGEPQRGERHAMDGVAGLPGEAGLCSRAGPEPGNRDVFNAMSGFRPAPE